MNQNQNNFEDKNPKMRKYVNVKHYFALKTVTTRKKKPVWI